MNDLERMPPRGLPPFSGATLEAIVVQTPSGGGSLAAFAAASGWALVPMEHDASGQYFDLRPPAALAPARAWDMVHQLRGRADVWRADPSWYLDAIYEAPRASGRPAAFFSGSGEMSDGQLPLTWAVDLISARSAWNVPPPPGGRSQGEGIRVAHPDSGYTRHHELIESQITLDVEAGYDFVADDADPLDDGGYHGTGTASVLASTEAGSIIGVAPRATIVPLRVAEQGTLRPEPVLLRSGAVRLRKAIHLALERDCHVISISLGWLANIGLHEAIRDAWNQNLIIVAAAGNYTGPVVVWPGRYPEVICLSGCDAQRHVWVGSAFGPAVDFSGPAEDVWKAGFDDADQPEVSQSSGTSFATAMTAGVAALWLAHHGRQALLQRYAASGVKLCEVFRRVLALSADERPQGGFLGWGPIINAERALRTPLPDPAEIPQQLVIERTASFDAAAPSSLGQALELLGGDPSRGTDALARTYGVSPGQLERLPPGMGDELAFHGLLAGSPELASSPPAAPPTFSEPGAAPESASVSPAAHVEHVERGALSQRLAAALGLSSPS